MSRGGFPRHRALAGQAMSTRTFTAIRVKGKHAASISCFLEGKCAAVAWLSHYSRHDKERFEQRRL